MSEEHPETRQLREAQSRRQEGELELAETAADAEEAALHERRAEKAQYLREKLDQRAESEREAEAEGNAAG